MRELAVIYGFGGAWPVSVALQMMSRPDSYFRAALLGQLRHRR